MIRIPPRDRVLFASGLIGMSLTGFRFGDFASVLQEIPKWVPARTIIPYAASTLMLLGGIGLVVERAAAVSARAVLLFLVAWLLLLNVPIVLKSPLVEVNWQATGEVLVMLAGGWVLHAVLSAPHDGRAPRIATGPRAVRTAQLTFGFALVPLGLAHFFYLNNTAPLVPAWLPWHTFWAYFTGAAQVAAGLSVMLSIFPRAAATLDALLLTLFTFLVWIPQIVAAPADPGMWSE